LGPNHHVINGFKYVSTEPFQDVIHRPKDLDFKSWIFAPYQAILHVVINVAIMMQVFPCLIL